MATTVFGMAVRSHWGIKNQVHWVVDVTFGEDHSRKRAGQVSHNFLRLTPDKKGQSLKAKRRGGAWDPSYLISILTAFKMR